MVEVMLSVMENHYHHCVTGVFSPPQKSHSISSLLEKSNDSGFWQSPSTSTSTPLSSSSSSAELSSILSPTTQGSDGEDTHNSSSGVFDPDDDNITGASTSTFLLRWCDGLTTRRQQEGSLDETSGNEERVKTNTTTTRHANSLQPAATMLLTELDQLVVDKVLSYLSAEDLRSFHQVCRSWKSTLEACPSVNQRRLDLVQTISKNKENMARSAKATAKQSEEEVSRANREGIKPGATLLKACENVIQPKFTSTPNASNVSTEVSTPPLFMFQEFEVASKTLPSGMKLISCIKCKGPVPSPIISPVTSTPGNLEEEKAKSTRCRLTTRMAKMSDVLETSRTKDEAKKLKTDLANDNAAKSPGDVTSPTSLPVPLLSSSCENEKNNNSSSNVSTDCVCPNPNCSFKFCLICLSGEHKGRRCRIIDSESFETDSEHFSMSSVSVERLVRANGATPTTTSSSTPLNEVRETKNMKVKVKGAKSKISNIKKSLRRIARI